MKKEFELEVLSQGGIVKVDGCVRIIGKAPESATYVSIDVKGFQPMFIPDDQLERFAVNILKAIKSKKLK